MTTEPAGLGSTVTVDAEERRVSRSEILHLEDALSRATYQITIDATTVEGSNEPQPNLALLLRWHTAWEGSEPQTGDARLHIPGGQQGVAVFLDQLRRVSQSVLASSA